MPRVSVIMPTYDQARFIRRALASLQAQTFTDWELIIVDDASPDATAEVIQSYLADPRVTYTLHAANLGLGAALNTGLDLARGDYLAYLPSDDVYYAEHLAALVAALTGRPTAALAYAGARHHYNRYAPGQIPGYWLQLVQVMHRRSPARWTERAELVTDDLGRMLWDKLGPAEARVATGQVTCEWVDHPQQLHKVIQEPAGGINTYRAKFQVAHPLRFHTTVGNRIDEVAHYQRYRERPDTPPAPDGLKIVLVGELAYNADRVLALEERGHTLYGLWMDDPYWYNSVGPVPFGHVRDISKNDWQAELRRIQPDVIYALLNWQAVPFAHHVLTGNPGIPFVWHCKEGPFICLEKGTWNQLVDLYAQADGQIYSSPEMRDWFMTVAPDVAECEHILALDGDLPKRDWFAKRRSPRRSEREGQLHTVVPGRPIGLHPETVGELAAAGIHLHFYGDFTQGQWIKWIERVNQLAPGYLHLHANVDQEDWTREFSQYDAGWLHFFQSRNGGDIRRADWDDLNYPARMATLAAAGLPMLQGANPGAIVATQTLARERNLGYFFSDMADLGAQLRDRARLDALRASVWRQRDHFTFDAHADDLIAFFRRVIGATRAETQAPFALATAPEVAE